MLELWNISVSVRHNYYLKVKLILYIKSIMSQTHQPNIFPNRIVPLEKNKKQIPTLSNFESNVANKFGYFAISLNRFRQHGSTSFKIEATSVCAQIIFWVFFTNTCIKTTFLWFVVRGYFGPLEFYDQIAAVDYLMCSSMIFAGLKTWGPRYPIHGMFKTNQLGLSYHFMIKCFYLIYRNSPPNLDS